MSNIIWKSGDIFQSKCDVITVTVNCVGVMGAGIAKTCRQKFPATYNLYRRKCRAGEYVPGQPHLVSVDRPLLLFPTKDHWRNPSQMVWIERGLRRIVKNAHLIESLALPPLGCGHGGLNWVKVRELIINVLDGIAIDRIEVYEPTRKGEWRTRTLRNDEQMIHSQIYWDEQ